MCFPSSPDPGPTFYPITLTPTSDAPRFESRCGTRFSKNRSNPSPNPAPTLTQPCPNPDPNQAGALEKLQTELQLATATLQEESSAYP